MGSKSFDSKAGLIFNQSMPKKLQCALISMIKKREKKYICFEKRKFYIDWINKIASLTLNTMKQLSLQEEIIAEKVKEFPVLYDKTDGC